ncbi:flavodoxin domain-containing protein [Paenibacillus sp. 481]|nr:flavodoxin domain-containing protein [Paenibacillus sp. 481]
MPVQAGAAETAAGLAVEDVEDAANEREQKEQRGQGKRRAQWEQGERTEQRSQPGQPSEVEQRSHAGQPREAEQRSHAGQPREADQRSQIASTISGAESPSLLVLYGSNLGTAEGIARELAHTSRLYGFKSEVGPLNDWVGRLPNEGAVVIVTASYSGRPPHNAAKFVQWLKQVQPNELLGVQYAVFGCGDRNWSNTYQDVPRWIDDQLTLKGGTRLSPRGEADAGGNVERQLAEWRETMWADMKHAFGLQAAEHHHVAVEQQRSLHVQFVSELVSGLEALPLARTYGAVITTVLDNRELQMAGSERSTRHIELAWPEGMTYQEGDHLGVLPSNSKENVDRILRRFRLHGNDQLILTSDGRNMAHLPLNRPVSLIELLRHSVEIQEPATRAQLRELAAYTVCPPHKRELEALLDEAVYKEHIWNKRISMLSLLEQYEACELPFEQFLELLPPLKPRYYSISSSPRTDAKQVSITVAVVHGPAWSGNGEYEGVASTYLATCKRGEEVLMFVRTPESGFQLPEDATVPIIMIGPGTGVAPFRGFLQARAALKKQGLPIGEAHLFFGCRNELDFIYREELEQFQKEGVVTLHTAFSRAEGMPKCYVQHLLAQHATEIIEMLNDQGRLYVCGDGSQMAPDVEATLQQAYRDVRGVGEQEAQAWLDKLQAEGRYAKDVWART